MGVILRDDLNPWPCDSCEKEVFAGESIRNRFYCSNCFALVGKYDPNANDENSGERSVTDEALLPGQANSVSESENAEVDFLALELI